METYVVRMWLPDRPGALGQVASRIGAVRGEIVGIEILERGGGRAIDELVVDLPDGSLQELLVAEIQQVDGVDVEEVRPVADALHDPRLDALETAVILVAATDRQQLIGAVVEHARRSVGAEWSAVVQLEDGAVLATEGQVPAPAWLVAFVDGSRYSDGAPGGDTGPHDRRLDDRRPDDVLWSPLPSA